MASKDSDHIDFNKLEAELHAAVESDQKYWRENDAKFRAVNQKVATYDEFRDIVKAAHLKPLEKKDKIASDTGVFQQPWNVVVNPGQQGTTGLGDGKDNRQTLPQTSGIPRTGDEFAREWRRHCKTNQDKLTFLKRIGGENLSKIFKTEISFGLLGDFLSLLCEFDKDSEEEVSSIMDILDGLSKAGRFGLSVQFLSSSEKENAEKIFADLQTYEMDDTKKEMFLKLKNTYGIKS